MEHLKLGHICLVKRYIDSKHPFVLLQRANYLKARNKQTMLFPPNVFKMYEGYTTFIDPRFSLCRLPSLLVFSLLKAANSLGHDLFYKWFLTVHF